MAKFNQDYKITIGGDLNGNAYWGLLRKKEWYLDAYKKFENVCIKD